MRTLQIPQDIEKLESLEDSLRKAVLESGSEGTFKILKIYFCRLFRHTKRMLSKLGLNS